MDRAASRLPQILAEKDKHAQRCEYVFPPPRALQPLLLSLLADQRDGPALWLLLNVLTMVVPAAVCMFLWCHSHWVGLLYLGINYATFIQRFMLTIHFTEHRPLFRKSTQPAQSKGSVAFHLNRTHMPATPPHVCRA